MKIRLLLLAMLLWVVGVAEASDPATLQRMQALRDAAGLPNTKVAPNPVPARLAGQPEYLVRVIYLMPSDVAPATPDARAARIAQMSGHIRAAVETMDDFIALELERLGVADPGRRLNLEREPDGRVRVIPMVGQRQREGIEGYWGDDDGTRSDGTIFFRVQDELFGDQSEREAATAKTVYLIFPDTLRVETSDTATTYRGGMGMGGSIRFSSGGWGGIAMVSAGLIEVVPPDLTNVAADRRAAVAAALCDDSRQLLVGGTIQPIFNLSPRDYIVREQTRAEQVSTYLGVVGHELLHAFGIIHDASAPEGIMGAGYLRVGGRIRDMYGLPPCGSDTDPTFLGPPGQLGFPFANFVVHCPYFNDPPNPDKRDPQAEVAYPPQGFFVPEPIFGFPELPPIIVAADDAPGLLNAAWFYRAGWCFDFAPFAGSAPGRVEVPITPVAVSFTSGQNLYEISITDQAGNHSFRTARIFTGAMNSLEPPAQALWVRRPPAEDTRPRSELATRGSFLNPYDDIATAITAASEFANRTTVLVGEGVWPITEPLKLRYSVGLVGESQGRTILDGGGSTMLRLIHLATDTDKLQETVITNLVFRNALGGINKNSVTGSTWNVHIVGNVFYNISGTAIDLNTLAGYYAIENNTVVACANGIRLNGYAPFFPTDTFNFRNNVVANCSGTGIRIDGVNGLYTRRHRSGWNVSSGNGFDWFGNGDGAGSYRTRRLTGESSAPPRFIAGAEFNDPTQLRPGAGSPLFRSGDPLHANRDGSRRDIGALIDNPLTGTGWMLSGSP